MFVGVLVVVLMLLLVVDFGDGGGGRVGGVGVVRVFVVALGKVLVVV